MRRLPVGTIIPLSDTSFTGWVYRIDSVGRKYYSVAQYYVYPHNKDIIGRCMHRKMTFRELEKHAASRPTIDGNKYLANLLHAVENNKGK